MKVLHLIGGELTGGAARGAYWLHQGLLKLGVESKVLTNSTETYSDLTIESIAQTKKQKIIKRIRFRLDVVPVVFYKRRKNRFFSTALFGYDFTKHSLYKWADIINLHWINGGFVKIKNISKVNKPIVWTIRDMWPMTGGCHYSMNCNKYENGCGCCDQLGSKTKYDLSWYILRKKKKYIPKHLVLVGISNWISDCVKKSYLFKNFRVETLYNNVNCQEFFPIDKNISKKILGLPQDKKIILAGATGFNTFYIFYKGFNKYLGAVKHLRDKSKLFLLFFGKIDKSFVGNLGLEYKSLGYLNDIISLRLAYSAADVFVAPSIMDAFGKTLAEAMACGTPVVAFNATGPKDIVDHKINGYLATPYDSCDLSRGIKWVLDQTNPMAIEKSARQKIEKNFDIIHISQNYKELYEDVLTNSKKGSHV